MKTKSLKLNFIMNAVLKMSAFIFPLITFPYVSRVLGADGNGKISFASSLVNYFTMFASLGVPTYGIRVCAQCRDDKEKLNKTVQELIFINTITTIMAYLCLLVLVFNVHKLQEKSTIILINSVSIALSVFGIEWLYQSLEEYSYITVRNLAFKVISVILMFLLVKNTDDYIVYAGINVIGTVGSNILNLLRLRKYVSLKKFDNYDIKHHIKPVLTFFALSVATTIYTSLDQVMLGFMASDAEVGYYAAAIKMKTILVSLVTSLGTVLLPRTSYYVQNGHIKEFKNIIQKAICFVWAIALPLTIFFMLQAKRTILILGGEQYLPATASMVVITPTVLLIGLSNLTGVKVLVPLQFEKYTVYSTCLGSVVDIIVNALLIPKCGAMGASIGTLFAEVVVLLFQIFSINVLGYKEMLKVKWKEVAKCVWAVILSGVAVTLLNNTVLPDQAFISFIVSAFMFFGLYGVIMAIEKSELFLLYAKPQFRKLRDRIKGSV